LSLSVVGGSTISFIALQGLTKPASLVLNPWRKYHCRL